MKKMKKYRSYPALFVPEQTENENNDSKEMPKNSCKGAQNKYDFKIFAKARKTKKA